MNQLFVTPVHKSIKRMRPIGVMITALIGMLLAVFIFGGADYTVDGLTFSVSIAPARSGVTTLDLSPFGSVSALTHDTPLAVNVQLTYIGTGAANIFNGEEQSYSDSLKEIYVGLMGYFIPFASRLLFLAFIGAFLSVFFLWRSKLSTAFFAGLLCTTFMTLMLYNIVQFYDFEAFQEPTYSGIIALAPQVIPDPGEFMDKLEAVQDDTRKAVENMKLLMTSANGLSLLSSPIDDHAMRKVLLVSDLHSNPLGVEFINEIAANFNVDLILDAGDLTDMGTTAEAEFSMELNDLKIPYVFCPGNHDSPEIIEFLNNLDNTVVLDGSTISVAGVRILGNADPMSNSSEVEMKDASIWQNLMKAQAEELLNAAAEEPAKPDIVIVHDPQAAEKMSEHFPVIVNGHTHKQSITISDRTIMLNPGTSGAAGLRGLYADQAVPYSAMVLYINKTDGQAAAVDTVKYEPFSDRFFIERKLLDPNLRKQQEVINEETLAEEYVEEPTEAISVITEER